MMVTKQLKEECMYHSSSISSREWSWLSKFTTEKLNQILHQSGECHLNISYEEPVRKLMERMLLCTNVSADYEDRSKGKRNKKQLYLVVKVVDYINAKFSLENELSILLD